MTRNKAIVTAILLILISLSLTGCFETNKKPIASFTVSSTSGKASLEVTFDASSSYDPDGNILSFEWNFRDGNMGSGETISHTFTSEGSYNVKLTVTDDQGATDSATRTISVEPPPAIDYRLTAKELVSDFMENEVRGDMKYEGTTIAVTGDIIGIHSWTNPTVRFEGISYWEVVCDFPESRKSQVAELSEDDRVTIAGDYDMVFLGSVHLDNCYVE